MTEDTTQREPEPEAAPGPSAASEPAAKASAAPAEAEATGKVDPQLVVLCVVLWLVTLGILALKWNRIRVDWYLGNIKETLDLEDRIDTDSADRLVSMSGSVDVVGYLRDELTGPNFNQDIPYRIVLVKVLERIPGEDALEALRLCARDYDARVRANVYLTLKARAEQQPQEREAAVKALREAAGSEPELVARAYAVQALAGLQALDGLPKELTWGFIQAARDARAPELQFARESAAMALRLLAGAAAPNGELPALDPGASPEVRDQQAEAWERWYRAQGGAVPEGQSFADFQERLRAAQQAAGAAASPAPNQQRGSE